MLVSERDGARSFAYRVTLVGVGGAESGVRPAADLGAVVLLAAAPCLSEVGGDAVGVDFEGPAGGVVASGRAVLGGCEGRRGEDEDAVEHGDGCLLAWSRAAVSMDVCCCWWGN